MNMQTQEGLQIALRQALFIGDAIIIRGIKAALEQSAWQGLSDSDFHEAHDIEFRRGAAWAEQMLWERNHG